MRFFTKQLSAWAFLIFLGNAWSQWAVVDTGAISAVNNVNATLNTTNNHLNDIKNNTEKTNSEIAVSSRVKEPVTSVVPYDKDGSVSKTLYDFKLGDDYGKMKLNTQGVASGTPADLVDPTKSMCPPGSTALKNEINVTCESIKQLKSVAFEHANNHAKKLAEYQAQLKVITETAAATPGELQSLTYLATALNARQQNEIGSYRALMDMHIYKLAVLEAQLSQAEKRASTGDPKKPLLQGGGSPSSYISVLANALRVIR